MRRDKTNYFLPEANQEYSHQSEEKSKNCFKEQLKPTDPLTNTTEMKEQKRAHLQTKKQWQIHNQTS